MKRVYLGKTDLLVSQLAFGTGTNGLGGRSDQSAMGIKKLSDLLQKGFLKGINFFDTADAYGTHPHIASALKNIPREEIVILTKTMSRQYSAVERDIDRFLNELGTDVIDIVLLHAMTDGRWTEKYRGAMEALSIAKEIGKVRAIGVSCHSLAALRASTKVDWANVVMVRMNYKGINMDGIHRNVIPVIRDLYDSGTGIIGMKVLGVGKLASCAKKSIDYIFSLNLIHAVTIGMTDKKMLNENIKIMGE